MNGRFSAESSINLITIVSAAGFFQTSRPVPQSEISGGAAAIVASTTRVASRTAPTDSPGRKSIEPNLSQLVHALVHKRTHLSGDESGLRKHDLHGHRFGFTLLEDITKLLCFLVGRGLIGEKHPKTAAVHASVQTAVYVVAGDRGVDRDGDGTASGPEVPIGPRGETGMPDARVPPDVCRRTWDPAALQVFWARADYAAHLAD